MTRKDYILIAAALKAARTEFPTERPDAAQQCDMMRDKDAWPYTCIDWEQAARELRYDYTSVDFDDVTYWIRS